MIAEILSVGTELLMGQITNTDAQYIARRLAEAGVTLHRQVTVGDNPGRIREAVREGLARADLLITTGGLGPTADDITKECAAQALGLPMERFPEAEKAVRSWFERNGRRMTENNLRQADFAHGAELLFNGYGTAPGCVVEKDGKAVAHLPGPPRELIPMVDRGLMPWLIRRSGTRIVSRYLRIYGMGESAVEDRIHDLIEESENPTIAPYCSTGECQLRLTVRCAPDADAQSLLDPVERQIRARLGDVIYAVCDSPEGSMEEAAVTELKRRGLHVATAESCTGGMIASKLVNVPGASDVLNESYVTYSNEAKTRILGVPSETLERWGAVSRETAEAMARGLRRVSGCDIALSVTGIAGPDGGTAEKPVGLVWLGMDRREGTKSRELRLTGDRERIRTLAALAALDWIRSEAKQ